MTHNSQPQSHRGDHGDRSIPEILDQAIRIAKAGAALSMSYFRAPLDVEHKSDQSPVTQADRAVEQEIRRLLAQTFPNDGILGEEFGQHPTSALTFPPTPNLIPDPALWIVDPIDGTRSFISGHPLFGILLGRMVNDVMQVAVVGLPALGEFYCAARGHGATCDGQTLHTSPCQTLSDATLYIHEAEKIWRNAPDLFGRLMQVGRNRRFAYDCAPYGLLAAGHIDAVIDSGLQPYDVLPVSLLVQEAGGVVTDWQGNPPGLSSDVDIVASATPTLHDHLLGVLNA